MQFGDLGASIKSVSSVLAGLCKTLSAKNQPTLLLQGHKVLHLGWHLGWTVRNHLFASQFVHSMFLHEFN